MHLAISNRFIDLKLKVGMVRAVVQLASHKGHNYASNYSSSFCTAYMFQTRLKCFTVLFTCSGVDRFPEAEKLRELLRRTEVKSEPVFSAGRSTAHLPFFHGLSPCRLQNISPQPRPVEWINNDSD